jgi:hypothetical protein
LNCLLLWRAPGFLPAEVEERFRARLQENSQDGITSLLKLGGNPVISGG